MELWELFVIAAALSMDAFAIAICKGLSVEKIERKHLVITGLWFGSAQALMPLLGYLLGTGFQSFIERIDHWVAFVLSGGKNCSGRLADRGHHLCFLCFRHLAWKPIR